ncbi:hypothetical protein [Acidilobus sp.]|jgi:endogenous inhibitor of DNA gyrase (YacG/DUF329 family)|uniref:hypothetical protein n=1 Tax=Acidilobus sp. TaxID=1872109 RepID=UPI003D009901
MQSSEIEVLCPRCKVPMNFYSRTERTSRTDGTEINIVRYYKCPVCGKTIIDEELLVRQTAEGVKITVKHNGLKKTAIIREVSRAG